jgi:hypothetical protein
MKILFIFLYLLCPAICVGQVVNIESDRGGDKQGIYGSSGGGLSLQRGNVQVFQYQLSSRLDHISGLHHSMFIGSTSYGEEDNNPFQNTSYAHLRWTAMWFDQIGTELFTQVQQDEFKLLQLRQLTGTGLRFTFFKNHLAVGLGGMFDYEQIEGVEDNRLDIRGTSYVRLGQVWGEIAKGLLIGYYQPRFTDVSDYRILITGALEFILDKSFSVVNELNYTYDTQPPEQVIKEDLQLRFKVKVKW